MRFSLSHTYDSRPNRLPQRAVSRLIQRDLDFDRVNLKFNRRLPQTVLTLL